MIERGSKTSWLWRLLWLLWLGFVMQVGVNDAQFGAPLQLIVLHVIPLLVFMPGVARDNLRSVIWLCFVIMGYFVLAVLAAFAQPHNATAIAGIVIVVLLFIVATLYIRFRGRELRASSGSDRAETSED